MNDRVQISAHPLVRHKLAALRHRDTPPPVFRQLVRDLAQLLFVEASRDLEVTACTVPTPLAECPAAVLRYRLGLVPILRAGLGMAQAILDLVPEAQVWHLGLYRDHDTLQPVTYYNKLPAHATIDLAFVLDPMLATGGSAVQALDLLRQWGVPRMCFLGILAAPEGVRTLTEAHPEVTLHLGALDQYLNEKGYIVPGLGDAGDRQFAT